MFLNSITALFRAITFNSAEAATLSKIPHPNPASASSYQDSTTTLQNETQNVIEQSRKKIQQALAHPDSETLTKMMTLNQKRKSQGQAPLDIKKVTQELEAIQANSSLNDKEKKKQVEALRKTLGLSKGEMKGLFTRRIEKVYQATEKSLKTFQETKETQLKSQLQQAEQLYGKSSPQAQAIQNKQNSLKNRLEPERHRLSDRAGFFHSLYPGFWSRLGGFFKKIGGGFLKVLGGLGAALRFLPGVGPIASSALGTVKSLLKGKIVDFGKGLLHTLKNAKSILPMIPAVGPIANLAVTGIESVMKATRGGAR